MKSHGSHGLVSIRSALVLALSLLVAIATGVLLYAAHRSLPLILLGSGTAFGVAVPFFDTLIDSDDMPSRIDSHDRSS